MEPNFMESLYKLHYERVYKSTYMATGDVELSKDATQEAFYDAFRKFHTLKDKTKFSAWVSSIALNKAIDLLRKNNQINRVKNKSTLFYINLSEHSPEDLLCSNELRSEIIIQLRSLPQKYAEILFLKFYHDLTEQEISNLLNIPVGTVKSRLYRAKELLKRSFEKNQEYRKVVKAHE